jgi:hypothetical protein
MNFVRLFPAMLSTLVLGAHFYRAGLVPLALGIAAIPLLFLVKHPLVIRVARIILVLGTGEWIRTVILLVVARQEAGQPWIRLAMILGGVAVFTLASALPLFLSRAVRRRYRLAPPDEGTAS